MYHLELRQFPHNLCRFNLTDQELRAVLTPWVLEKPLELGERKWSPHQATLTVLAGPRLELQELSMGRGWRAAQRSGEDVTNQVITAAREQLSVSAGGVPGQSQSGSSAPAPVGAADAGLESRAPSGSHAESALTDPLAQGVELASLLGSDAPQLLAAWRESATRNPGLSPSETLALAEASLESSSPNQP